MKRLACLLAALAVPFALATASSSTAAALARPEPFAAPSAGAASPRTCTTAGQLAKWSLTSLADQTIAVPVQETELASIVPAAEDAYGGLLLFGSSAPSDLGAQLTLLRAVVAHHLGLLVMTDEEGGEIQRMANLVGSMPWARTMAATMTSSQIKALARRVGSKMVANGVNVDLAPVLDVDGRDVDPGAADPDGYRSFSGNPRVVGIDGTAFMLGMKAAGVLPVVKHFPGLGGASGNTDDGPATTLPWTTLEKVAIPPFVSAIKAGAPAVMINNAVVPGLTSGPASLSSKVVTTELRDKLGFKGLVVTDSLSALAIADIGLSVPAASADAIAAGNDVVLYGSTGSIPDDLALAKATAKAIVAAVHAGRISRSELEAATTEVLKAKKIDLCHA